MSQFQRQISKLFGGMFVARRRAICLIREVEHRRLIILPATSLRDLHVTSVSRIGILDDGAIGTEKLA